MSSIPSNYNGNFNLPASNAPWPICGGSTQEAHRESLLEKFVRAFSPPPQFALEEHFKGYLLGIARELQGQAGNDSILKLFFDKVVRELDGLNQPPDSVFSPVGCPIHLTDRFPMDKFPLMLAGIVPSMGTDIGPKDFNKTIQNLLLNLLEECFRHEGKLFELVIRLHRKLDYPYVVYKSSASPQGMVKILHVNITQFALVHRKIFLLQSAGVQDIPRHFTQPLSFQLVHESHPKFTLLRDKNIHLHPIQQPLFYKILRDPHGLECFFQTTPIEVLEPLADYLLRLLLRGDIVNNEYKPHQDPDTIVNFLFKMANLSIKFNLDEVDKQCLLTLLSRKNKCQPPAFLDPQAFIEQLSSHIPSPHRISKDAAFCRDKDFICKKFQNILTQKHESLFIQGHDLSDEDLNWVVLASLLEKDYCASTLLYFLNLKKTSLQLQLQNMTYAFIRKFSSFQKDVSGGTRFAAELLLEPSYFNIPHEVVKLHIAFILEYYTQTCILSAYLNLLGSTLALSEFLTLLNLKFKFKFSSARHGVSITDSSIISLIHSNLLSNDSSRKDFSKKYGIDVDYCRQTFISIARLKGTPSTALSTYLSVPPSAPFLPRAFLPGIMPPRSFAPLPATPIPLPASAPFLPRSSSLLPAANAPDELFDIQYLINAQERLVIQMYKKISRDLLMAWRLPETNDLFIKAFIAGKGLWGIDLNPMVNSKLQLLRQSLAVTLNCTEKDLQLTFAIVKDVIKFFHFFDSSKSSLNPYDVLSGFLPQNRPSTSFQDNLLTTHESLQAAQAVFDLKISEFQWRIEHLKHCLCKEKKPPYKIPCYLVAQNLQSMHIQIMEAEFNEENSLVKLAAPTDSACHLLKTIAPRSGILKTTARIAMEDLQDLHRAILESKEPCALVLEKNNKPTLMDHSKKRTSEEDKEAQPRKKKKLETDSSHKGVKHMDIEISSAQQAIENFPIAEPSAPPSFLPQIPPPAFPKYSFGFEDFWKMQSLTSLDALTSKIDKHASRLKSLIENTPLTYPILNHFPNAGDLETLIPCYNPLLKPYQQREVSKLIQYASKGVSRMLTLEMGLGKTYVYGELIAQRIASKAKGINLVIVPKSILQSIHEELKLILGLGSCSAWKIHCENSCTSQQSRPSFSTKINHAFENGRFQELCLLLPLASNFSAEDLYRDFFKLYGVHHLEKWKAFSLVLAEQMASFHQCHSTDSLEVFSPITAALEKALKTELSGKINPSLAQEWTQTIEDAKNTMSTWMGSGKPQPFYPAQQKTTEGFLNPLLHAQCLLAASLLKIIDPHPQINAKLYPQEQALQLGNFSLDNIDCCGDVRSLKNTLNRLKDSASVVVTTYEAVAKNPIAELVELPFSSIIVDEAHRLTGTSEQSHGKLEKNTTTAWFQSFIQAVQPKAPAVVLVTGTPLQNTFSEILTLLHLSNPGGFDRKTSDELVQMNNLAIKKLITYSNSKDLTEDNLLRLSTYIIRPFAHFEAFKQQIVCPLVEQIHKEDPAVIHDWQGLIPKRVDFTLNARITAKTRSLIEEIVAARNNFFESNHGVKRILLHPDLALAKFKKLALDDPKVKEILKKSFVNENEQDQWISNSPLLDTLVNSESLVGVIKNKQQALVITEYVITAKILKKSLQSKFSEQPPEIKIFHGKLTLAKRQRLIHWFKTPSALSSKILILMQNVGGLGLNLPEASHVFMTSMGWNPAKDDQAIARALRVGSFGQRQVTWINYGVYPQDHSNVIKTKKRAWEKFFWNDQQGLREQFKNWLDVLRQSCLQGKLNACRNLETAKADMHSIEEILSNILQSTSDQLLQQAFDAVLPKKNVF
jgi:superfamily II DNA or RNA helicase